MRVLVALAIVGAIGCGRGDPRVAAGSHYGVGVPRTAFIIGHPPQTYGNSTGSFVALEHVDYRPRLPHAWPPSAGTRLPLTWAQYRGSPSNR
jgi:hypothetical protein